MEETFVLPPHALCPPSGGAPWKGDSARDTMDGAMWRGGVDTGETNPPIPDSLISGRILSGEGRMFIPAPQIWMDPAQEGGVASPC